MDVPEENNQGQEKEIEKEKEQMEGTADEGETI